MAGRACSFAVDRLVRPRRARRACRAIEAAGAGGEARELTFDTKTDDDTERQLVHTLAHAIVFIVSICYLSNFGGAIYLPPFFSNGPANKRRAGPSCDEPGQVHDSPSPGGSITLSLSDHESVTAGRGAEDPGPASRRGIRAVGCFVIRNFFSVAHNEQLG